MEANGNKVLILCTEMPEKQTVHREKTDLYSVNLQLQVNFRTHFFHKMTLVPITA